jgi:hypothetical protein
VAKKKKPAKGADKLRSWTRTEKRKAAKAAKAEAAAKANDKTKPFDIWVELERLGPMPDPRDVALADHEKLITGWHDKRMALWAEHDRRRLLLATVRPPMPWRIQELLTLGPPGGFDPDQFEAAVEIAEAFRLVTAMVGFKPLDLSRIGHGNGEPGARGERAARLYVAWGNELTRTLFVRPHLIVECIEGDRTCDRTDSVKLLIRAVNLWIDTRAKDEQATSLQRERLKRSPIYG